MGAILNVFRDDSTVQRALLSYEVSLDVFVVFGESES